MRLYYGKHKGVVYLVAYYLHRFHKLDLTCIMEELRVLDLTYKAIHLKGLEGVLKEMYVKTLAVNALG